MIIREQIKTIHEDVFLTKEKLIRLKGFTEGKLLKVKCCKVGRDINDIYLGNNAAEIWEQKDTKKKHKALYSIL